MWPEKGRVAGARSRVGRQVLRTGHKGKQCPAEAVCASLQLLRVKQERQEQSTGLVCAGTGRSCHHSPRTGVRGRAIYSQVWATVI